MPPRKGKVKLLRGIYAADAAECHKRVVSDWRTKKTASHLGEALDIIRRTEYFRELKHRNFRSYLEETFGAHALEAFGYAEMYRLKEIWPAVEGVNMGRILPQALGLVGPFITPSTAGMWLPIAQFLTIPEIRSALKSYHRNRTGIGMDAIFIPLWLPQIWYNKHWKPHEKDQRRPFLTLLSLLKARQ